MADFNIKRNDTEPPITATLEDSNGAIDLTGSIVKFIMKDPNSGVAKVDAQANITDPVNGLVQYQWQVGDTDTGGFFFAEWEVTLPSGRRATFPNDSFNSVLITEDLG